MINYYNKLSFLWKKGGFPTNNSYSNTPSDHQSAR